jgi:imidazolonepropionase-like amidohydrolase
MNTSLRILGMLLLLLWMSWFSMGQTKSAGAAKVFIGATLIDGAGNPPLQNAVVVVRNGRVEAVGRASEVSVPSGAQKIDLKGKFLLPGLLSTHVHVSDIQGAGPRAYTEANVLRQLRLFARYGITSVWSLGGDKEPAFKVRAAQNSPSLDRARIFVAGDIITGETPEQARQMVAKVAAEKPDIIKIRVDDNLGASTKMKPEVYRAVIEEAHRRQLPVAAHIFYLQDAKDLLRAGVDMIAHSVRDQEIDDEFIDLMKQRNVPYCPTLTRELATFVYESKPEFFSDPFFLREADPKLVAQLQQPEKQEAMRNSRSAQAYKQALEVARKNLRKAADAGVLIVMGTDSGAFPERFQGYFEHLEMEMMAESGLTPDQVLRSATGDAARGMGAEDVGTIRKGSWADFLVLDRNPLQEIRNTRSISSVWVAGNQVERPGGSSD